MKRTTALRMANAVAAYLHSVNGLIATPGANHEALRVKRAWLFGSTAKGSAAPNDVDILLDMVECGRRYTTDRMLKRGSAVTRGGAKINKMYYKRFGIPIPIESTNMALRRIKGTMKRLSLHDYAIDGKLADGKILLYPRNDLI